MWPACSMSVWSRRNSCPVSRLVCPSAVTVSAAGFNRTPRTVSVWPRSDVVMWENPPRQCDGGGSGTGLTEPAADVVLGRLYRRRTEQFAGVVHLDQLTRLAGRPEVEEPGVVADPSRLLH